MKRFFNILVIVMLTSSGTLLFAQANNTVFKTVTGTVEVKAPGSSSWITACPGYAKGRIMPARFMRTLIIHPYSYF
ncbi:hypothetical protein AGMMS49928_27420 [Spirochaetia bacterium]|nr:hypothetical protein AGMMS49928_27420 [Spirochaetia bacterium]